MIKSSDPSFIELIRKLNSRAAPELGVGAEFVVEAVGVKHIAVDAPLAVAGGEAKLKVLEAGVFSGGTGEGLLADHAADGRFGGEVDAGAFDDKIVGDAGLKIPAVVNVVVVGRVDIRRKERLVAAEENRVVKGDFSP